MFIETLVSTKIADSSGVIFSKPEERIKDLRDDKGQVAGTKVVVKIPANLSAGIRRKPSGHIEGFSE